MYSVPQLNSSIWSRDGTQITTQNSAKYETSSSSTIVKDKIHGKEVQLDGYNVTLTIRDLIAEDFTDYTVTLINGFGTVTHTIVLESAGKFAGYVLLSSTFYDSSRLMDVIRSSVYLTYR